MVLNAAGRDAIRLRGRSGDPAECARRVRAASGGDQVCESDDSHLFMSAFKLPSYIANVHDNCMQSICGSVCSHGGI